jgi:hypothetical protein
LGTGAATKSYVDTVAAGVTGAATALNNVGRNLIHNPLFNVAQRGVGPFTANSAYSLDRWQLSVNLDTLSVSQVGQSDSSRAQVGDEALTFALQAVFTGNAGAGAYSYINQPIETVRRLSGKTVTVSFWALGSAALKVGINMMQSFGTGGSPSAPVWAQTTGAQVIVNTTWARYSTTIAIPSSAGKTFGTSGDFTELALWFSAATTAFSGNIGVQSGTIQIWGVQLEVGSVATPLEKPDPRYDLANCQRFYQTGFAGMSGYNTAGNGLEYVQQFPVQMRANPTMASTGAVYSNMSGASVGPFGTGMSSFTANATITATGAGNYYFQYTASADL